MKLNEALAELRKNEKRKFDQTVEIIVNLKGVDLKREAVNVLINIPHKIKDKKVFGFLNNQSDLVKSISKLDFPKYHDKKLLKRLVKEYDFFIASAPLMPSVATTFGKVLGPAGKMPSPQLGVLMQENDKVIKELVEKISTSIKIRAKEASIKVPVGKESMKDEEILANASAVYKGIENALPTKRDNVRNVLIKLTMSKPVKVEM